MVLSTSPLAVFPTEPASTRGPSVRITRGDPSSKVAAEKDEPAAETVSPLPSPAPPLKAIEPTPSVLCSSLRPGVTFSGYQTSGDKRYRVEVNIKDVDLERSSLCGDLVIHGLTPQYPKLSTFFDAEVVGDRHGFKTGKWDASWKTDLQHWRRFDKFAEVEDRCLDDDFVYDVAGSDMIFMRWKERFIMPVQRTKLKGASFAGFYYICLNRRTGCIDGLYYHAQSEMYQRLYLALEETRAFQTYEFR